MINYAKLAVLLERRDDPVSRALSEVVMARAEGARGLGGRVDATLERLETALATSEQE